MARPEGTFNKKEFEKKRQQKRKEKEQRKEERKANAKETGAETMAYVDENGNITSTPPGIQKRNTIRAEDIVTGSRNIETGPIDRTKTGKVIFYNSAKGFGFIKDSESGESVFVHNNGLLSPIKENDSVTFETERGPKGLNAVRVKTT